MKDFHMPLLVIYKLRSLKISKDVWGLNSKTDKLGKYTYVWNFTFNNYRLDIHLKHTWNIYKNRPRLSCSANHNKHQTITNLQIISDSSHKIRKHKPRTKKNLRIFENTLLNILMIREFIVEIIKYLEMDNNENITYPK